MDTAVAVERDGLGLRADEAVPPVVLLGDERLRKVSDDVADVREPEFLRQKALLQAALRRFRAEHGFGRAISAPQIGFNRRFIALNLGKAQGGEFVMINPRITYKSDDTFTMWDDCMSFPFLMVKVRRHSSISVGYIDSQGAPKEMHNLDQATSELLQHEIDHLDGVLAVDRAVDVKGIISRQVYEEQRASFDAQVDYSIVPTIGK